MEFIRIPKVDKVKLMDNRTRRGTDGTLYLTATHLIFVNVDRSKEQWIVHTHISSVEKLSLSTTGSPLVIRCKTFQVFMFMIAEERDCHDLYSSLVKLCKPIKLDDLYAFSYNPRGNQLQTDGWDMFKLDIEFERMGLQSNGYWKMSDVNGDFKLCDTYPQLVCVPSAATTALLQGSASFRSKGRLPVLSYLHKNGAVISRCSQPLSGLNSRSVDDEAYVNLIRISKPNKDDFMYIVDTRPRINAVANRAQGKGYENMDFYGNIKYHFLGIDNIHVMRASLTKLLEVCEDANMTMGAFLEGINNSGWLRHVHNVLQVSRFIANAVGVEGRSVLVHCSDGWDRTAQTCSLAAIMLNPHYRTVEGFLALVQKEWLAFGHKFTHRLGHLEGDPKEVSPVFTQFIDAVWQLMRYRPAAFQFNEQLLLDLHDHAMSCQFGTFIGNCERERLIYRLEKRTHSLWGWMWKRLNAYSNPLYSATERHQCEGDDLLLPSTCPHAVRFWRGMYNRFDTGLHPRESITEAVATIVNENTLLQDTVNLLCKRLKELGVDAGEIVAECKAEEKDNVTETDTSIDNETEFEQVTAAEIEEADHVTLGISGDASLEDLVSFDDDTTVDANTGIKLGSENSVVTPGTIETEDPQLLSKTSVSVDAEPSLPDGSLAVSFSSKNLCSEGENAEDRYSINIPTDTVKASDSWEMLRFDDDIPNPAS